MASLQTGVFPWDETSTTPFLVSIDHTQACSVTFANIVNHRLNENSTTSLTVAVPVDVYKPLHKGKLCRLRGWNRQFPSDDAFDDLAEIEATEHRNATNQDAGQYVEERDEDGGWESQRELCAEAIKNLKALETETRDNLFYARSHVRMGLNAMVEYYTRSIATLHYATELLHCGNEEGSNISRDLVKKYRD